MRGRKLQNAVHKEGPAFQKSHIDETGDNIAVLLKVTIIIMTPAYSHDRT